MLKRLGSSDDCLKPQEVHAEKTRLGTTALKRWKIGSSHCPARVECASWSIHTEAICRFDVGCQTSAHLIGLGPTIRHRSIST